MRSKRSRSQKAALVAVVVGAGVMAFALFTLFTGGSDTTDQAGASDTEAPLYIPPSTTDTPAATDETPSPSSSSVTFPGAGINSLNGLSGNGGILGIPKHTVVMRITSSSPIAYVGWVMPTSIDNDTTGTVKGLGTSWSLTKRGYGPPDYAQLFSIESPGGTPVTCTITVDGRVTESRTTTGPYDQLFCQG